MSTPFTSFDEELSLTEDYRDIAVARRFASEALTRLGFEGSHGAAVLIVSELVANALRHGSGGGHLRLSGSQSGLRVEVRDGHAPHGRMRPGLGLTLVEALSDGWGVLPHGDGKVVWCELGGDSERPNRVKLQYDHATAHTAEAARR